MIFRAVQFTGIGGRPKNEDACFFGEKRGVFAAAVADGLGGHGGGEIASEAALAVLAARFDKVVPFSEEALLQLFSDMNSAILSRQQDRLKMKSTAALFLSDGESAAFAHVGDSRIYHFRGAEILYQSRDHSASQLAVAVGEISPAQLRFHEDRNIVLRSLGNEGPVKPEIHPARPAPAPGDTLLLCTDGFWEYVTEIEMQETLARSRAPREWLDAMVGIILEKAPPGHDNFTAVAVFCE
jgi:serine/threonine protein phosphatase PrpC